MAIDKQIESILEQYATYGVPPIETLTPQTAREVYLLGDAVEDVVAGHLMSRMVTVISPMPEQVASVRHHVMQTSAGPLLLRIYYPKGDGPFPGLLYFHGGGFVIANLNTYDASCRALCNAAECVVVSVAYRQAPENPFPAAVEDAYAATRYVQENPNLFSIDPARIAIGGESAGGNLATVTAMQLRDRGEALPVHQLLIYPVVNWAEETPSYSQYANAKPLNTPMLYWFKKHYLKNEADARSPLASPLFADSLAEMPPATILAAENDPLRSEGQSYADKLRQDGVPVSYTLFPGSVHEFFGMAGLVGVAKDAVKNAAEQLKAAFAETADLYP